MEVRPARLDDVPGICRVCAEGWRDTYAGLLDDDVIERTIADFYNEERVLREVESPEGWDGWLVAELGGRVVAAGGGGVTEPAVGEVFVLYVDPCRRGGGIGTRLLEAITEQQRAQGAREQWVSVQPGNEKGFPFYRARGFVPRGERPAHGSSPNEGRVSLRLWRRI
jgi:GNAT superfamily N-acetyltransferase